MASLSYHGVPADRIGANGAHVANMDVKVGGVANEFDRCSIHLISHTDANGHRHRVGDTLERRKKTAHRLNNGERLWFWYKQQKAPEHLCHAAENTD